MSMRRAKQEEQPQYDTGRHFTLSLKEGVAASLAPTKPLDCHASSHIQKTVANDDDLLKKMNEDYLRFRHTTPYAPGFVSTDGTTMVYQSNDYMEHNLTMKVELNESDGYAHVTRMTRPNTIQAMGSAESFTPPALSIFTETIDAKHHGCFRKLFKDAADIEHEWKEGAPIFSAIGVGLMAMKNRVARPSDFTNLQSKHKNGVLSMYDIVMQLTALYAQAAVTFETMQSDAL